MQTQKLRQQDSFWALFWTSLLFLIFFRARWALRPGVYDDQCYLEWLHKFVFVPFPVCYSPSHLPGVAIQWIPVGWLSRLLSLLTGLPLLDWLAPLIGLQTFATWGVCLWGIHKIFLELGVPQIKSRTGALVFLLNVPALEFLTQLNFGTVAAELLFSVLLIYQILKKRWFLAVISAFLLNLTRVNDTLAFLLIAGALLDLNQAGTFYISEKNKKIFAVVFLGLLVVAISGVLYIGLVTGYNHVFLWDVLPRLYPYRWWRGFFMGKWGIFWTAPAACFGFVVCCGAFRKLSWFARAGLLWVFSEIALVIALNEIRSDYVNPPWRYLLGSFIGMIPALVEVSRLLSATTKKWVGRLAKVTAVWQMYLAFVTHSFTILQYWKTHEPDEKWSMLEYLYLLHDPGDLIKLLYMAPVGFSVFSWGKHWPFFKSYEQYLQYALQGPELYLLTLTTGVALATIVKFFWDRFFRKTSKVL